MTREDEYFCSLSANDQKHYLEYENMVKNNEKPQANNGWIKCSERLPESSELVLVYVKTHLGEEIIPVALLLFMMTQGKVGLQMEIMRMTVCIGNQFHHHRPHKMRSFF